MNPLYLNNKRYYNLDSYFKNTFSQKIFKISLNANLTCPNIDGTKGIGGCIYCSKLGSGEFAGNPQESLKTQFEKIKNNMHVKWKDAKYIAYFQAFTNTYSNVEHLRQMYEEVLTYENVVGISISTRPDCLPDDIVDLLIEISKKTFLIIELGLQTIHEKTSILINRCHNYDEFLEGYNKLKKNNLNICIHIINGLPYETKQMMIDTVKKISTLGIHSIKIHMLHILKNTKLAHMYKKEPFHILTLKEYVDIVCDQLELIDENVVVQRITGDGKKEELIEPLWSLKKFVVINEIDKELKRRQSFQGKFYKGI